MSQGLPHSTDENVIQDASTVKQEEVKIELPVKQETPSIDVTKVNIAETIGGSQTRKYLNEHVTPVLLQGMRLVAKEKPENPLKFLGEFLLKESENRKD